MFALLTLKKFMILFGGVAFFFKLINCGISKTFIEILRFMHNNVRACVKTNNGLTDFFSNDITDIFYLSCEPRGGGGTWVRFCWVCAAGLSEPPPHYSLFCGQL